MKKNIINNIFMCISLIVVVICGVYNIECYTFLGIYLLMLNFYILIKCKRNKPLFLLFLIILYFNFSIVVTKYLFTPSDIFNDLYRQLRGSNTMLYGILFEILFMIIIGFFLGKDINQCSNIFNNFQNVKFKYRKVLVIIMQILLITILFYHIFEKITGPTTILEYSIYIFIFTLFLSKDDKLNKIISEIILLSFVFYFIKNGERIAVLQFLIVDFLINYISRFSIKQILLIAIIGIFLFTMFGIYGDSLINGNQTQIFNIYNTYKQIKDRRFALDTSICAYFSGLSMIDVRDKFDTLYRIQDGIEYLSVRTILGSTSKYIPLNQKIMKYQHNVGGGMLVCYFYFWFGILGVIAIAIFVANIIRLINKNIGKNSLYFNLLSVFIISTIPRWYLYEPNLLFRGVLIFTIIYIILYYIFFKSTMKNKKI